MAFLDCVPEEECGGHQYHGGDQCPPGHVYCLEDQSCLQEDGAGEGEPREDHHFSCPPGLYLCMETGLCVADEEEDDEEEAGAIYGAVIAAAVTKDENALRIIFKKLVDLQHELEEDVRFTKAATSTLAVKDGPDEDGLWQTIRLWQNFIEQRLMSRQNELQQEFQDKLKDFLKKDKGLNDGELPSAIGFGDLTSN